MTVRRGLASLASGVAALAALATGAASGWAQRPTTTSGPTIVVRDVGPGRPGRIVRQALTAPHAVLDAVGAPVAMRRGTVYPTTVLALAPRVTVASTVHGDVVVVGGDLFLHPGAVIDGRAVAIGGAVYNSSLADVRGGEYSFRDQTFAAVRSRDTVTLAYRSLGGTVGERAYLPGVYGINVPSYDRVDGLSARWGPAFALDTGRVLIEPLVTYRSHVGAFDPSVAATVGISRRTTLAITAGRGTWTNDAWTSPDAVNSAASFAAGVDSRNYYRADAASARVSRLWEGEIVEVEPYVGASTDFAWSTGAHSADRSLRTPFSVFRERDSLGMLRPNPEIRRGRTSSALAGVRLGWELDDLTGDLAVAEEVPFRAPGDARFAQTTIDGTVAFDALFGHRFEFFTHAVITGGDPAPPQRFAYLGGTETLITLPPLSRGGDQLLFVESSYAIPLDRLALPLVGVPTLTLRHLAGGAGRSWLPRIVQNAGVRLTVSVLRVDFLIDPETRDTDVSFALAFFR